MLAASRNDLPTMRTLLDLGADPNARSAPRKSWRLSADTLPDWRKPEFGVTPLQIAIEAQHWPAAKMLVDDMQALGAVRLRDVDEAQALLVNKAKEMAAKGEILIAKNRGDEELVY